MSSRLERTRERHEARAATPRAAKRSRLRRASDWLNREDFARELLIGVVFALVLGVGLVLYSDWRDQQRQERADVLENTRFVRGVAMAGPGLRPFEGLNLSNAELSGLPLGCAGRWDDGDLDCAKLSRANLSGADLLLTDLSGALMATVDLSGANLYGADLSSTYLGYADLSGADLSGADLSGADLYKANLHEAKLSGAKLITASLAAANLSGADLSSTDLTSANLFNADLSGAKWGEGACFTDDTTWPEGYEPPKLDPDVCL